VVAFFVAMIPARSADLYQETAVKAAFLYRFTGYVEWPRDNVKSHFFTIAVLGSNRVSSELQRVLEGRTIKDRQARVKLVRSASQALDSQVLYVGSEFDGDLFAVTRALEGKPILVVTDDSHGLDVGATISFVLIDRRVRFDVSLPAAQEAGLKISSELLGVAASVRGAPMPAEASTAK
jgi:hypothetical protein